jgi:hypothetical protein
MIKTTITAGVLFLLPTLVLSQQVVQKPILCDETSKMLPYFEKEHGEKPTWIGKARKEEEGWFVVMKNPSTGTWTLIQYNAVVACLLGDGTQSLDPEKIKQKSSS